MPAGSTTSIRRLTVSEAIRMVDVGILQEDERVELLEGLLVEKSPRGPLECETTAVLADRLRSAYSGKACVREEKPLQAGRYSLPEPNIAVVRAPAARYVAGHPRGADGVLVIDVVSGWEHDGPSKSVIYAAAGVPAYWRLNPREGRLEIGTGPDNGTYVLWRVLGEADAVALPEVGVEWTVRDLLP